MFETISEAEGEGGASETNLSPISYLPFQGCSSVVVPQCYMLLYMCVYGLQQYGHPNNSCLLRLLLCNLKL